MAIRALIGFDHLEGLVAWPTLLDHGLTFNSAQASNYPVTGGWLGVSAQTANQYLLNLDIPALIDPAATKYVIGMRLKCYSAGTLGTFAAQMGPGFSTTGVMSQLAGPYSVLAVAGGEAYLEFEVDLTTGVIKRWVDNVATTDVTLSVSIVKLFRIVTGWHNYSTWKTLVRDIYVCDDVPTEGDTTVSRLGPQKLIPIVAASVVGEEWVANSGTLLSAVNPAGTELPITSKVTSPGSRKPLTLGLAASIPVGAKINGIDFAMGAKSLASGPTLVASKLIQGESELVGKTPLVPMAQSYDNQMGLFHKAPDGGEWTNAKLNATSLVITPDVSG